MGDFWTVFGTALVTMSGAWFAYWLVGKPRLILFSPNSTVFNLDSPETGTAPMTIKAGQVIVQNNGRRSASNVQFVAEPGIQPWGYNIVPSIDHKIRCGTRGEWILELEYLGPGEAVTVQVLNGPQIASVRSKEGAAKFVPVVHQRLFPVWFQSLAVILMTFGLITVGYGVWYFINLIVNLK